MLYKEGKRHRPSVHVLVADAFLDKRPSRLHEVMHKDDVRDNNVWTNLQWGTKQDNMDDMVRKGRQAKGADNGVAKYSSQLVLKVHNVLLLGMRGVAIARSLDMPPSVVNQIKLGRYWGHLTGRPRIERFRRIR